MDDAKCQKGNEKPLQYYIWSCWMHLSLSAMSDLFIIFNSLLPMTHIPSSLQFLPLVKSKKYKNEEMY